MKTKAHPATVHGLDQKAHPTLHSTKSANRISKATNSNSPMSQRTRTPYAFQFERQTPTAVIYGECSHSLPVDEMAKIYQTYGWNVPMTIYTRSQDRSQERNEVPGCKFRKFFGTDEGEAIESLQQKQFVGLTVFMREDDKEKLDPKIYVEQSIIQDGKEKLIVHELNFRGLVQTGIEYMFRGLGDEHPEFGKGDLRVRFLSVNNESFETYTSGAGYYGYDQTVYAITNRKMLDRGQAISTKQSSWGNELHQYSVAFDPADLRILLDTKQKTEMKKKQGASGELELLKLCIHKVFPSEDGTKVGDLNVRVVYKP